MANTSRLKKLKNKLKEIEDGDGFVCDENGRAIINVGAENYDDIFSLFCYKGGDTLSSSLVEYLNQKASVIPLEYDLTIKFHVKNANDEKRKEIQAALKENYQSSIYASDQRIHRTTVFSLWFLILGIIFATTYILTNAKWHIAITYVIDLFAWVFLWEGIDAFYLDRRMMKLDKIKALRLATANVETVEFEPY